MCRSFSFPSLRLLVTGAAGFIGSHFVLRHAERFPDDALIVLDALTYAGNRAFLDPIADRMTFIEGDIADTKLLEKIIHEQKIDTIINFAAESHVDNSITDASPFLRTNILGVQSIIEAIRANPHVRLLHISTDEVFGDLSDAMSPRVVGDILLPSSPYAASKASAEMLILAAIRTYKIHACISRCTNNYGPHQDAEKFIPTVIRKALKNQPIPLYGDGRNSRDWLYVTDHTDALELILQTPWAFWDERVQHPNPHLAPGSGHIFHISQNHERRNIDVAKAILHILGKPESLLTFVTDRPGHDWRYALDSSSMRSLGWTPKVAFEGGLQATVQWYL